MAANSSSPTGTRFSLRTLLVATILAAIFLRLNLKPPGAAGGLYGWPLHQWKLGYVGIVFDIFLAISVILFVAFRLESCLRESKSARLVFAFFGAIALFIAFLYGLFLVAV